MMFDRPVVSLLTAQYLAFGHVLLLRPSPKNILDTWLQTDTGSPVQSVVGGNDFGYPLFYYARSGGKDYLLISGVQNVAQGQSFYNGYLTPGSLNRSLSTNTWVEDAATAIYNVVRQTFTQGPQGLLISGYSAGHAIGEMYANQQVRGGNGLQSFRISFGGPRALTSLQYAVLSQSYGMRWMNAADPVPLMPPHTSAAAAAFTLGNPLWAGHAGLFYHQTQGVLLSADGTITPAPLPPAGDFPTILNIASWLLSSSQDPNGEHAIGVYKTRLDLAVAKYSTPQEQETGGAGGDLPDDATPAELRREAAAQESVIFQTGAKQNQEPVFIPPDNAFKAVKAGRTWQITFNGGVVAVAPTKRRARHMANAGNSLLRSMQTQAVVDPTGFIEQFQVYAGLATDPASGFVPVMNDDWPSD